MPLCDWTGVEAGIFHAFHHEWISELGRALNRGVLPKHLYALPEQVAAGFGPDVLTLQHDAPEPEGAEPGGNATALQARPRTMVVARAERQGHVRKKKSLAIRHVSGDRVVAIVEIVSPGNKESRRALAGLVEKACAFLDRGVHLLVVDPFPPGLRDPDGLHALIWQELGEPPPAPLLKPLALLAYEADGLSTLSYVVPVATGEPLPEMPLFIEPNGCVMAPLEETCNAAFAALPQRWRDVLQPPSVLRD